jgi:hypothetical protein
MISGEAEINLLKTLSPASQLELLLFHWQLVLELHQACLLKLA